MRLHPNARTCPHSRLLIATRVLESGWSLARAAEAAGVSERTARKWVRRYREHGQGGLVDRSSAPELVANRTPESGIEAITKLRRLRMSGEEIAEALRMPLSTLGGILTRIGLGKRSSLEPREPPLPQRESQNRQRLPHTSPRLLQATMGHHHQRGHDRQRPRLHQPPPRPRLPHPRPQTQTHTPLPATNQRQSRTPDPHTHRRLGLRHHLHRQPRTRTGPTPLPRLLQSPPTPQSPQPPNTRPTPPPGQNNLLRSYTYRERPKDRVGCLGAPAGLTSETSGDRIEAMLSSRSSAPAL